MFDTFLWSWWGIHFYLVHQKQLLTAALQVQNESKRVQHAFTVQCENHAKSLSIKRFHNPVGQNFNYRPPTQSTLVAHSGEKLLFIVTETLLKKQGRYASTNVTLIILPVCFTPQNSNLYFISSPKLLLNVFCPSPYHLFQKYTTEREQIPLIQNSPWTTRRPWAVLRTRVPGLLAAHT